VAVVLEELVLVRLAVLVEQAVAVLVFLLVMHSMEL
jgi:hypothetical protein